MLINVKIFYFPNQVDLKMYIYTHTAYPCGEFIGLGCDVNFGGLRINLPQYRFMKFMRYFIDRECDSLTTN